MQDKTDEVEDQPRIRRRINPSPSSSADTGKEVDCMTTSNPQHGTSITSSQQNKNDSHLNEVLYFFFCQTRSVQKIIIL